MNNTTIDHDVVVVGGGIAGLIAAWQLRHLDVAVFEAADRVGGRIKSVQSPDGYWANIGAHTYPAAASLMGRLATELGLEVLPITGSINGVGIGGRVVAPPRMELMPFSLRLPMSERAALVRVGMKMLKGVRQVNRIENFQPETAEEERRQRMETLSYLNDVNFADYMGGGLPPRVQQLIDCVARRAAADPEEVSAGTALSCMAHVMGPKDAPAATTRVLKGGTEQVVFALAKGLGARIHTEAPVTSVRDLGDRVEVTVAGPEGRAVTARAVVVATPAHITRATVQDLPTPLDNALGQVTYGSFTTMAIFTDETQPLPIDDIYAVTTPGAEFDFLFNHAQPVRGGTRRSGGALMVYRGGPWAASIAKQSDDVIAETYLRSVYELVPGLRGHVVSTHVQRWDVGTIYAAPGRAAAQPALEAGFDHGRIALAGDYFDLLSGMEPAARSAHRAVERVRMALL